MVEQIPVERLFGPAVVIDVRDEAASDPDYSLPTEGVEEWEARHGRIPPGAIILLRTGWCARWPESSTYMNASASGSMHFPGFGRDAAQMLVERGVYGIGTDTASVDAGRAIDYPVHQTALGAGLYLLENLADLSGVPETGAFVVVAPMKLIGASGAPCRVFAFLP
jgi:kynurenine formamidase